MDTQTKRWAKASRLLAVFAVTLLFALTMTPTVHAGEYIEGEPDAVLEEGEVVEDDLFIGGEDVLVAGVVEGDLFAGGNNVVISGEVYGNVFAAGQSVTISGSVDGAVMMGGYALTLEDGAYIGRNVYFGAFSLEALPDSEIGRSVYGGAYQMILSGLVERDVTAGLAALEISGPVGGDVTVEVSEPDSESNYYMPNYWAPGMPSVTTLDPGYSVDEDLVDGTVDIRVTQVHTDVNINPSNVRIEVDPSFLVFEHLRRRTGEFIALLVVGALGLWLMRDTLLKAVDEVKANAGMDTLWGMLVYALYPMAVLVLFVLLGMVSVFLSLLTLGNLTGEVIGVSSLVFIGTTTVFWLAASLVTKVIVAYLVGRWLLDKMAKLSYASFWHHFAALALGVFFYEVLRVIPIFGFFVMLVVVVIGAGAIFVLVRDRLRKAPPSTPSEVTATPA